MLLLEQTTASGSGKRVLFEEKCKRFIHEGTLACELAGYFFSEGRFFSEGCHNPCRLEQNPMNGVQFFKRRRFFNSILKVIFILSAGLKQLGHFSMRESAVKYSAFV